MNSLDFKNRATAQPLLIGEVADHGEAPAFWAHNSRRAAEIAVKQLRDRGYPVDSQFIDRLAAAIDGEVRRYLAAEQVKGMAREQLSGLAETIFRNLERLTIGARSEPHGGH